MLDVEDVKRMTEAQMLFPYEHKQPTIEMDYILQYMDYFDAQKEP